MWNRRPGWLKSHTCLLNILSFHIQTWTLGLWICKERMRQSSTSLNRVHKSDIKWGWHWSRLYLATQTVFVGLWGGAQFRAYSWSVLGVSSVRPGAPCECNHCDSVKSTPRLSEYPAMPSYGETNIHLDSFMRWCFVIFCFVNNLLIPMLGISQNENVTIWKERSDRARKNFHHRRNRRSHARKCKQTFRLKSSETLQYIGVMRFMIHLLTV